MSKTVTVRKRRRLFLSQEGKCFYCSRLMWEKTLETPIEAIVRLESRSGPPPVHLDRASRVTLRHRLCTLEHLTRRVDGGTFHNQNLVAACGQCNSNRQEIPPEVFSREMQQDVSYLKKMRMETQQRKHESRERRKAVRIAKGLPIGNTRSGRHETDMCHGTT